MHILNLVGRLRPLADDPSSLQQKLVPESCTRNLCPSRAHPTHKELVRETWRLTIQSSDGDNAKAVVIILPTTNENNQKTDVGL